jgi:hypothetical protein
MIKYGEELFSNSFNKIQMYSVIYNYFENPNLTKIKDVDGFSMYGIKIKKMTGSMNHYLIAFVEKDTNPEGFRKSLNTIDWISFQTRILEDQYNVGTYSYTPKSTPEYKEKIDLVTKDENVTTYKSEKLNITLSLLHTRKNNIHQYANTGYLCNALETFQTILTF